MEKSIYEINSLANELIGKDIILICEKWIEEQERWENYDIRNCFFVEDSGYDGFMFQIMAVEPSNRTCLVMDLSQFSRPVSTINYLPKGFPTQELATEHFNKRWTF